MHVPAASLYSQLVKNHMQQDLQSKSEVLGGKLNVHQTDRCEIILKCF